MNHSPYLDLPLFPLAVALPRILQKVEAALALAGPENRHRRAPAARRQRAGR